MADCSFAGSKLVDGLVLPASTAPVSLGAATAVTMPALTLSAATIPHTTSRIFKTPVLS